MSVKRATALVCAALVVAAAACSGADSNSAGDKVRYGYDLSAQFTNTFDVSKSTGDCDGVPLSFIYDNLLSVDRKTKELAPRIATKWEVTGDAKKQITFTLRDDVSFTDGTKLDAKAVKAALERNNKNDQLSSLDFIDSIDVLSPTQLRINMTNDQAIPLLYALGDSRDGMIMSPKSFATADKHPVGSGPFKLESFEPGRGITLVKNPDYWDKPKFDFPGIDFVLAKTGPPAVTRFRAGDLDIVRFEAESLDTMKGDRDASVVVQPSEAYLQFQFRLAFKDGHKSPFADPRVRQAIRYGINAAEVNQIVQRGQGEVATQSLPKNSPGYDASLAGAYPYNPEKAKDLLRQAGYPNGFEFTMAIPGPGIKSMESQGAVIQDQLSKIGVKANIKPILGQDIATQYYIAGGGDAFAAAHLASTFYPGVYYDQWGKYQFVPIWNGAERADIDALTLRAQATTDPAETQALTRQAAKIVSDDALEVPIAFMPQFLAYNKTRIGGTVGGQTDICKPPDLSGLKMKG
ncbi:MAG: ABC transporter substrate-binding protein [Acidimicrobiia bacterium]